MNLIKHLETGGQRSLGWYMGLQRVWHDLATEQQQKQQSVSDLGNYFQLFWWFKLLMNSFQLVSSSVCLAFFEGGRKLVGCHCFFPWVLSSSVVISQMWLLSTRHVGSSWIRDRTCVPCIGRPVCNHWTTREVPICQFLNWVFKALWEQCACYMAQGRDLPFSNF